MDTEKQERIKRQDTPRRIITSKKDILSKHLSNPSSIEFNSPLGRKRKQDDTDSNSSNSINSKVQHLFILNDKEVILSDHEYSKLEPILIPNEDRWIILPNGEYLHIYKMYEDHESTFWRAGDINKDLQTDINQWKIKVSQDKRNALLKVLTMFLVMDGAVTENLVLRFYYEVQVPEIRCFYSSQIAIENVHNITYSNILRTYMALENMNLDEVMKLRYVVEKHPATKAKLEWTTKFIADEKLSFHERLVGFTCVEGIFFSVSFCVIFWIRKQGILPGLTLSNEFISRDEGMHAKFACAVYRLLKYKLPQKRIYEIFSSAVDVEKVYARDVLVTSFLGFNADMMCQYVEFIADLLLILLGYQKLYNSKNPFPWMSMISVDGKTNFHEKTVSEYAKDDGLNTISHNGNNLFNLDSLK